MADSKIILITGASTGIGAATARAAAIEGHQVALLARSKDKLDALVDEIGGQPDARGYVCDVTNYESLEGVVAQVEEDFGRIDVVFANAGTGGRPGGFAAAPIESWQDIVNVNILGVAYTLRASIAAVKKTKGQIVITGSVAGRRTLPGSMYSASKWAVSAIGYGVREELRGTGVRVTLIEPGMVDTPFFDDPKPDALRPEDIARSVIYAISQPPGVDVHEVMVLPTPPVES